MALPIAALLAGVLHVAPPAAKATELAREKAWDQLLLAFATLKQGEVSKKDAGQIARAFTEGCMALTADDAILAFDLGKHAAALEPNPEALLCWARAARATEQRESAEEALRLGMKRYPKDGRFALELGEALLTEGDARGALTVLERLPRKSPEAEEAQLLVRRARALTERASGQPREGGASPLAASAGPTDPGSTTFESGTGPGDIRTRSNRYFEFKYFNNRRDFGQRAEFEGQVADALEGARRFCASELGAAREKPVEVILYTREEFALHHGEQNARVIAGLYSQNAMRVNAALELTPEHRATLTHEYVHAVVDDLAGQRGQLVPVWMNEGLAEYLEWRFQGRDEAPPGYRQRLRSLARQGSLPPIGALNGGPLIGQRDPGLLYAYSALAVRLLVRQSGRDALVRAVASLGSGVPLEEVFRAQFGTSLGEFEHRLAGDLSGQ